MDDDELLKLLTGERTAPVRICRLSQEQQKAINAQTSVVWLSRYTASKVESKHRDRQLSLYTLAPTIIRNGETRVLAPRHLVILYSRIEDLGRPYRAVIKATKTGSEVYLDSVYRIQTSQIAKTLAETAPLANSKQKLV
jgi:hypothetical protein